MGQWTSEISFGVKPTIFQNKKKHMKITRNILLTFGASTYKFGNCRSTEFD